MRASEVLSSCAIFELRAARSCSSDKALVGPPPPPPLLPPAGAFFEILLAGGLFVSDTFDDDSESSEWLLAFATVFRSQNYWGTSTATFLRIKQR